MKSVKQRLHTRTLTVGSWLSLANVAIAEIQCNAGFEWIGIDLEHGSTTLAQAEQLIRVIDNKGCAPLVRLSALDATQAARVMDAGAHGLIVPKVCSAADAEAAVRAMYYPPRGQRGVGLSRAQRYGAGFDEYRAWLEESAVLVVQIEHVDALDNLNAIFGTEGVDAYLVGPYDLAASMGLTGQFDHPDFVAALDRIRTVAQAGGLAAGIHVVEPDPAQLRQRIDEGYTLVCYSVDFRMVDVACRAGLAVLEEE